MNSFGGIVHDKTGLCLDLAGVKIGKIVNVAVCNPESKTQRWKFEKYCF